MKLNLKTSETLIRLSEGEKLAYSSIKNQVINELIDENILKISGKHRRKVWLDNTEQLKIYLLNQYNIKDLQSYTEALKDKKTSRAEFTRLTGDSKLSKQRSFKGFLVNTYKPVKALLNGSELIINPLKGSFMFIYDFENFVIPENITIVGIENPQNFRYIHIQSYLFETIEPLFVSRYPQTQSKDFIRWMKQIPNKYLHFGDFDYAGINIYLSEYKKHLGERARFMVPKNIEEHIENGSRERYNKQKPKFSKDEIQEPDLSFLIKLIEKEQKGLDQEYYITKNETQHSI